jgi:hypothetical protein
MNTSASSLEIELEIRRKVIHGYKPLLALRAVLKGNE